MPETGNWGVSEAEYATLSPPSSNVETTSRKSGTGTVGFRRCTWEELPTLHHLVNTLADLPNLEQRGGYLRVQHGGSSVAETVRLA